MEACDYQTAISRASNLMEWNEEKDGYQMDEASDLIIALLTAMYPAVKPNEIKTNLNDAVLELIEDSYINHTQDQDDASQRAEELQMHPPKDDD